MMDWANHNSRYHADDDLCQFFYSILNKIYTEKYRSKYESLGAVMQHSPKGMSVQKTSHPRLKCMVSQKMQIPEPPNISIYSLLEWCRRRWRNRIFISSVKIKPNW